MKIEPEKCFEGRIERNTLCEAAAFHDEKLQKEKSKILEKLMEGAKGSVLEPRDYERENKIISSQLTELRNFRIRMCKGTGW